MPFVKGFLRMIDRRGRPIDPGFGVDQGGEIDNELPPGEEPVDPDFGVGFPGRPGGGRPGHFPIYGAGRPIDPGFGVPLPPIVGHPLPPDIDLPGNELPPTYPDRPPPNTKPPPEGSTKPLPKPPGGFPRPPVGIWPPPQPVYPELPIYPTPPGIGGGPALPPGSVWPPLPPEISGPIICFVWIVGVGYRWASLDPALLPPVGGTKPSDPNAPQPKG